MLMKNCFAYISEKKCACLTVMNCSLYDECCFYKSKELFDKDLKKSQKRIERLSGKINEEDD